MGISAGAAAAIGAGVSAAAGLAGSAMQAGATSNAANLSRGDARIAYLMQDAQFAPYRSAGENALGQVQGLTAGGWGGYQDTMRAGFQTDPGYQFALDQGLRAVDATQNQGGTFDSGARDKARLAYAEGLAAQQYGNYANRFNNYVNQLYQLATIGENAAARTGAAGTAAAQQMGNAALLQGSQQAANYGSVGQGIGSAVNTLFNNQAFQNWLSGPPSFPNNATIGSPNSPSYIGVASPYT